MWTKVVLAALIAATTSARMCGELSVKTYTDTDCSAGEKATNGPISECSTDYFATKLDKGTVAAYCHDESMTLAFFEETPDCTGDIYNAQSFKFDTCVKFTTGVGSFKIIETTKRSYDELTKSEYEQRFNSRWDPKSKFNLINYGPNRRFVPPIDKPVQLLTEIDRYELLISSNPWVEFFTQDFLSAIGSLDAFDLFWYNNAGATGTQLYPTGISKYYDMYSWPGFFKYNFAFYWVWFTTLLTPFTFGIPLNIWLGLLNGMTLTGIWKVLIPPYIAWALNIQMENGWTLY